MNKNPNVSFCSLGADHALQHVNRSMKVAGGMIGITLNPNARIKYFLIAPELAKLADQAKQLAGTSSKSAKHHHDLNICVRLRQEKSIEQLSNTIKNFTNPFLDECDDLYNIVTKVVMPDKLKDNLCYQSSTGAQLLTRFTEERIKTDKCSIWSKMKKRKLKTWKRTVKVINVKRTERRSFFICTNVNGS